MEEGTTEVVTGEVISEAVTSRFVVDGKFVEASDSKTDQSVACGQS